ncbi:MAG TPA: RNA polymerase factor sigma-54, partial [Nitrospiria bacterium]|nr:RNA polymerase factor sigma-54 [Nitrospiria bacterium]
MKTRLDLRLTQKLVMTPQLQQAIKLLQLSRLELQQTISQTLLENPLLEEEIALESSEEETASAEESPAETSETPATTEHSDEGEFSWEDYFQEERREWTSQEPFADSSEERPSYEQTLSKKDSLEEYLLWQLGLSQISEGERAVGELIIGNLDDDGYLRISLDEVAATAGVPVQQAEKVLNLIQDFDPPGVGARDMKECLLIQVRQLGLQGSLVEAILKDHLPELETRRYPILAKRFGVSIEEVCHAAKVIEGLEPKPGRPFFTPTQQLMIPDIFVVKTEEGYQVVLSEDGLPRLRVSPYYRRLLSTSNDKKDATRAYIEEHLRSALWVIKSIEQRNRTICRVAESVVKFQQDFFEKGAGHLKPLVLKQVAEDIGMHESTISRATTNKYLSCLHGLFELKYFFTTGISKSGEEGGELSSSTVRELLRKMVAEEDPKQPLTDQEIVASLH